MVVRKCNVYESASFLTISTCYTFLFQLLMWFSRAISNSRLCCAHLLVEALREGLKSILFRQAIRQAHLPRMHPAHVGIETT